MADLQELERYREIDEDGCWLWTGGKTSAGYGATRTIGKRVYVHRVAYEYFKEPIGEGLDLHHTCEKRSCFNPSHLQPLTKMAHQQQHAKQRHEPVTERNSRTRKYNSGSANGNAKLNEEQVVGIMEKYVDGEKRRDIAAAFGISKGRICDIVNGKAWAHLFS